MTVKGGTNPACAVCKFQRRKCKPDCVLAPHFPSNQSKAFHNVHRLFGVSNIMKILKRLSTDEQKEEAMKSIKYESDMRQRYPVYGCAGIICQLRQQLSQSVEELNYVYAQLSVFREQQLQHDMHHQSTPVSYLQLGQSSHQPEPEPSFMMNHHQFMGMGINEYEENYPFLEQNYYDDNNTLMPPSHHVFNSNVVHDIGGGGLGKQVYDDDDDDSDFNTFADDTQSSLLNDGGRPLDDRQGRCTEEEICMDICRKRNDTYKKCIS